MEKALPHIPLHLTPAIGETHEKAFVDRKYYPVETELLFQIVESHQSLFTTVDIGSKGKSQFSFLYCLYWFTAGSMLTVKYSSLQFELL